MTTDIVGKALTELGLAVGDPEKERDILAKYRESHPNRAEEIAERWERVKANLNATESAPPPPPIAVSGDPSQGHPLWATRFRDTVPLRRGGTSVVYQAFDTTCDQQVAVKLLKQDVKQDAFESYCESLRSIEHKNVVRLFDAVYDPAAPAAVVMELMPGGRSVQDQLDDLAKSQGASFKGMKLIDAVRIARIVAETMAMVHQQHGLLHLDLKASNVLTDGKGEYKIADFGMMGRRKSLFTNMREWVSLEDSNRFMGGTPSFMAPEQVLGGEHSISEATDVYGIGAMLYHMATGKPPFAAPHQKTLFWQVLESQPEPFVDEKPDAQGDQSSKLVPNPQDLQAICFKCLAKQPFRRYGSAKQLAKDLRRLEAGKPVQAGNEGWGSKAVMWMKAKPNVAAAVILTALLFGMALGAVFAYREMAADSDEVAEIATKNAQAAKKAQREAEDAKDEAERQMLVTAEAKKLSDRRYYCGLMKQVEQAWRIGRLDIVNALLDLAEPLDAPKGFEWDLWSRRRHPQHLHIESGGVAAVDFHPTDGRVAGGMWNGSVRIWNPDGSIDFSLPPHEKNVHDVVFSPDGSKLATCGEDQTIKLWDLSNHKEPLKTIREHKCSARSLSFSPDGTQLAAACLDNTVRVWNLATGEMTTLKGHSKMVLDVDFHPSQNWLVSSSGDFTIRLWDLDKKESTKVMRAHAHLVNCVAFNHDGSKIASGGMDRIIVLWDVEKGVATRSFLAHREGVTSVQFAKDDRLVSVSLDGAILVWEPPNGDPVLSIPAHDRGITDCVLDGNGKLATASMDRSIRLWNVNQSDYRFTVKGDTMVANGLAFFPDGKKLVLAGGNTGGRNAPGELALWDLGKRKKLLNYAGVERAVRTVRVSPDGKLVIAALDNGQVKIWNAESGAESSRLPKPIRSVNEFAFSGDGKTVAVASGVPFNVENDGFVEMFHTRNGESIFQFPECGSFVTSVAFNHDATVIAAGLGNGRTMIWDVASRKEITTLGDAGGRIMDLEFSPDGSRLVTVAWRSSGGGMQVVLWDWRAKEPVQKMYGNTDIVSSVAFSPDGSRLVTGSGNPFHSISGDVRVWDVETGLELMTFYGQGAVQLATMSAGKDLPPKSVAYIPWYHYVTQVEFSPDGKKLAASYGNGTVTVWQTEPHPSNPK